MMGHGLVLYGMNKSEFVEVWSVSETDDVQVYARGYESVWTYGHEACDVIVCVDDDRSAR